MSQPMRREQSSHTRPEVDRRPPESRSGHDRSDPPVALDHVTTRRCGGSVALDDVSLVLSAGRIHAVVGPSGSGKSTLIAATFGTLAPTIGRVRLFGEDPRDRQPFSRRAVLAPCVEGLTGRLTVRATIASWKALHGSTVDVDETLSQLGLAAVDTRAIAALSGDLAHLVVLAMVSIADRPLVLLDEPTRGLGRDRRDGLKDAITAMAGEGRTILLTTERLDEAEQLADHVHILRCGRLVASGTVRTLALADAGITPGTRRTTYPEAARAGRPHAGAVRRADKQVEPAVAGGAVR